MLAIHELVVHLVRGGKLLENRDPGNPIYSFWDSMQCLRCCHFMQSILLGFIRSSMCLHPDVP